MSFEELVGQHLMIGVPGTQVTPQMFRLFQQTHAAGFIVFRPNFESAAAFKKLISDLESQLGRRLLVAVDHEGGRVIHLREGITVFPDNWALGNTGREDFARRQGGIEARELRRLGIDINLAPTLDVLTDTFSPNIGIRSYGKDPELVAKLGVARIEGMQANGLSACAKHFPGLGASPLDPHLDLPVLSSSREEMKRIHLKPFIAAIQAGVDAVMSSHFIIDAFVRRGAIHRAQDSGVINAAPTDEPVTFSKRIIGEFLRKELHFEGVIFSDDLEMGALKNICSIGEAAVRAVEAGHDIVLVCHEAQAQRDVYRSLLKAYQIGRLEKQNLEQGAARIEALRNKRAKRFDEGPAVAEPEGQKLAERIAGEGVRFHVTPERSSRGSQDIGSPPKAHARFMREHFSGRTGRSSPKVCGDDKLFSDKMLVIFPHLSFLASKIHIEEEMFDETAFVKKVLGENEISAAAIKIVGLDPSDADVERIEQSVKSTEQVLFFCFDAHLSPGTRKLLEMVQTHSKNPAVVLLRDPYDEEWVREGIPCATAYGFRAVQIRAAVKQIL